MWSISRITRSASLPSSRARSSADFFGYFQLDQSSTHFAVPSSTPRSVLPGRTETSRKSSVSAHRYYRLTHLGQVGDTLLEVTLAIAILGVLLGGTYAIARRGLQIGQASQERIEALKILEGQAERLRAYRDSTAWNLTTLSANPFCFLTTQTTPTSLAAGQTCGMGQDGRYKVIVTYQNTSSPPVFLMRATWQGIGGTGDRQNGENVEYRYRLW